jgi:dTDP-glucose pyrophosphorylase
MAPTEEERMKLERVFVDPHATVRDAIERIDETGKQIALVVDGEGRLLGVITDGDIRRGILRGVALEAPVVDIMNASPRVADSESSPLERAALLRRHQIRHLPIVDRDGVVRHLETLDSTRPARVTTPVIVMAGGRGQRLYPLTKDVPKPMLPVGGVPLLEIILRSLASQGFTDIRISVNYLAEVIVDHVGDGAQWGLDVRYLREDKPLGTAGALAQLAGAIDEPFIVMNSDLLTRVDLRRMLQFHAREGAKATMGVREYAHEIPFGVVELEGNRVRAMSEKPVHRALVNAGIYVIDPAVLDLLEHGEYCDMPSLLGLAMQRGDRVDAFPIHEDWLDVGRPEDLSEAQAEASKWTR